jgi:hypothetical protein
MDGASENASEPVQGHDTYQEPFMRSPGHTRGTMAGACASPASVGCDQAQVVFRAGSTRETAHALPAQAYVLGSQDAPQQRLEHAERARTAEAARPSSTGPAFAWVIYQGQFRRFRVTSSLTAGQLLDEAQRFFVGPTTESDGAFSGVYGTPVSDWCLMDLQGTLIPRACLLISREGAKSATFESAAGGAPLDGLFPEEVLRNAQSLEAMGAGAGSGNEASALALWLWPVFHLVRSPAASQRRRLSSIRSAQLATCIASGTSLPTFGHPATAAAATAMDVQPSGASVTEPLRAAPAPVHFAPSPGDAEARAKPADDSSTETEADTDSEQGHASRFRSNDRRLVVVSPNESKTTRFEQTRMVMNDTSTSQQPRNTAEPRMTSLQACGICGQASGEMRFCILSSCRRAFHPSCMGAAEHAETPFLCDQHGCSVCGHQPTDYGYLCKMCTRCFCARHAPAGRRHEPFAIRHALEPGLRIGIITCAQCVHEHPLPEPASRLLEPDMVVLNAQGAPWVPPRVAMGPLTWTSTTPASGTRLPRASRRRASSTARQVPLPPAAPLRPEEEEAGPLLVMTMLDDGRRYVLGTRTRGLTGYDEAAGLSNNRFLQAAFLVLREAEWMRRRRVVEYSSRAETQGEGVSDQDRDRLSKARAALPARVEMDAREILRIARARGFNPTVSPEPHNTFSSQIYRNMKRRRESSPFRKADRGKFTLAPWVLDQLNWALPASTTEAGVRSVSGPVPRTQHGGGFEVAKTTDATQPDTPADASPGISVPLPVCVNEAAPIADAKSTNPALDTPT